MCDAAAVTAALSVMYDTKGKLEILRIFIQYHHWNVLEVEALT